jgi:alpha-beta hydrolase superfamily lysophospholipase
MFLFLNFLITFLVSQTTYAKNCQIDVKNIIQSQYQKTLKEYSQIDPQFKEMNNLNQPYYIHQNEEKVVFLVHGFLGSPYEMSRLAYLAKQNGYSVYNGLMPGFGASALIANQFDQNHLVKWYRKQMQILSSCYQEIHAVGFSTGALLAYDFVVQNPRSHRLQSLTLISPYFTVKNFFGSLLHDGSSLFVDSLSISNLYKISRFPDIKVMLLKPDAYLQDIPLQMASEIKELGKKNFYQKKNSKINLRTLVFQSDQDQVSNTDQAETIINANLLSPIFFKFSTSQKAAPHHLMSPHVSEVYKEVEKTFIHFLKCHEKSKKELACL